MAGRRYSSVTALCRVGTCSSRDAKWRFSCDCGQQFETSGYAVRSGRVTSCPKCSLKRSAIATTKHGKTNSPEFRTWTDIQTRCHNERSASHADYGGRGIVVCGRWRASFEDFLADMGPRPTPQHSIERIENDGNYEPGNCRWATRKEQANNKRNNLRIEIDGETKTLAQWADELGVSYSAMWFRYQQGARGKALLASTRRQLTHNGITDSVSGWARRTGLKTSTISMRITQYGWPVERALSEGVSN